MLVQDVMQRGVVVVSPETELSEAARLLRRRGIRHLPVLDRGSLVGIISDRDLKGAMGSAAMSQSGAEMEGVPERLFAADVMTRTVITIAPMFPVEEAARLMVTKKISGGPGRGGLGGDDLQHHDAQESFDGDEGGRDPSDDHRPRPRGRGPRGPGLCGARFLARIGKSLPTRSSS